jgi:thioredoxin reductase
MADGHAQLIILGSGPAGCTAAVYAARANRVNLMHRRGSFRAEKILQDKLRARSPNGAAELGEVLGDPSGVGGVRLKTAGGSEEIAVGGLFVAIGHTPSSGLFEGQLALRDGCRVVAGGRDGNAIATSLPGVFAAGDVADLSPGDHLGRRRLHGGAGRGALPRSAVSLPRRWSGPCACFGPRRLTDN